METSCVGCVLRSLALVQCICLNSFVTVMTKGEGEIAPLCADCLVDFELCMSLLPGVAEFIRGRRPYAMFPNRHAWKQAASGVFCILLHSFNGFVLRPLLILIRPSVSLSACLHQPVPINLPVSTCLYQLVSINMSLSTCLYRLVCINLSLSICLCHLVSGRLGRR